MGLSRMLWTKTDIITVTDGTRVERKCPRYTLIPCRLCIEMEKYNPNLARFFMHMKYTTLSTQRIGALGAVIKIFPEG
jgi:hypothetical protein